ncbi:MAG TPA: reverse transcriptase domain-containing protein, partial [Myxococcota bacterium]|nr:reverse transcriptase domain-containing protein [Myxococcota bacterium]
MRRARGLFERLVDPDRLRLAMEATVRGKGRRADVCWMLFRQEEVLADMEARLRAGRWAPAPFSLLRVRDPKPRLIARAPIEDRVVHTAIGALIEPCLLRTARPESFACRPGRGAHRAGLRLLELARRHRYALHLDLRSYFPSIDTAIVRQLLAARVDDPALLEVVDRILSSGTGLHTTPELRRWARLDPTWPPPDRGLPVGTITSQLFAGHLYLDALDHEITRRWRVPGYVRYMDDLVLFADRRSDLRGWRAAAGAWLDRERGLRLKHPEAPVLSCHGPLDLLGFRVRRDGLEVRARVLRGLRRRIRRMARGRASRAAVRRVVAS